MAKRQFKHRYMITRTLSTTSADITYFDQTARENKQMRVSVSGRYTGQQFMKKAAEICGGMVLMVENMETETKLYAISVDDFLAHAVEVK